MFKKKCKFKKVALQNAAFFILTTTTATSAHSRIQDISLDMINTKATALLLQKQKLQALQLVSDYIKSMNSAHSTSEANDFLETVSKTFMSKESQEAYESSLNSTIDNKNEAVRQAEICLQLDPQNSECLVQKSRLAFRSKNATILKTSINTLHEAIPNTKTEQWVKLVLNKTNPDFKNQSFIKKLPDRPSEDVFPLITLELDRSFAAKNFSRAKEIIQYIEKYYVDWPEIIFYKQKIETESAEEALPPRADQVSPYSVKCKSLSKSVARKYRYDFELCLRGQP